MIVDTIADAVALSRRRVPVPVPQPDAEMFHAQVTPDADVVLHWRWRDGRHLALGVVDPSAVESSGWTDSQVAGRTVATSGPGSPRGGQRAYTVIDGSVVVAGGSLPPHELAAVVACVVLRS